MSRPRIVVLGMMAKMPVAGVVWQNVHYLLGFERLGYEAWYVEAHGINPSMFSTDAGDPGTAGAAEFLDRSLGRFGLGRRWAFHARHDDGAVLGVSEAELAGLFASAALIVNLHGGTTPLPEHAATGRLVYLETDPVQLQVELSQGRQETVDFLEPHVAFFTFGENCGRDGCLLPVDERFAFRPTRQPVTLDLWDTASPPGTSFTTVGNWRQRWRSVHYQGATYTWSKHHEWQRFLDLPAVSGQDFEVALAALRPSDRRLLEDHGWRVRPPAEVSDDPDAYRDYVTGSAAEFTVAKEQNVAMRTGWFSDRSATYLAAGRPVVTQDTGFGAVLPTGEGLLAFEDLDGALDAVQRVAADPAAHGRQAREIARTYFDAETVLGDLLAEVGL